MCNKNLFNIKLSTGLSNLIEYYMLSKVGETYFFAFFQSLISYCTYIYICRVKHSFQYITCQAKQAALRFNFPHREFHLPHHSVLNKSELNCEDSAQNITYRVGQSRVLFCLPDCSFLPNSLATCNGASGYILLHTDLAIVTPSLVCNTHPLL